MAFQFRRDNYINWVSANPILAEGEPAYELDRQVLKIGDGLTAYNNLPQYGGPDTASPGGRLSVTPNVPVPDPWGATSWTTSANTIWYVPYMSDRISLWNGTSWRQYTFDNTTKLLISSLAASKVYDIFAYQVNGTVTLSAVQWTNNVTRATALVLLNGILVRSGMANMRYLGTIRTNTTAGTTSDLLARRFVYNYYNQVQKPLYTALANPHTYATSSWRVWNNATGSANCLQLVTGVRQPIPVSAQIQVRYGYFQLRFMAGLPYTTTVATDAAAGATTISLAVVDDNIAANWTTLSGASLPADPRITVTAVNGNVLTLNQGLPAAVTSLTQITVGPQQSTADVAANIISPTQLAGVAFATVTTSGVLANLTAGGFGAIVPCEYGVSADSYFSGGAVFALPMM